MPFFLLNFCYGGVMRVEMTKSVQVLYELHNELNRILDEMAVVGKECDDIRVMLKSYTAELNFNDEFYELCRKQTDLTQYYLDLSAKRRDITSKIYVADNYITYSVDDDYNIPF